MPQHEHRRALIIFGKNPAAGNVKTRLAEEIGLTQAADLYRAFLLDSVTAFARPGVATRLYLAPSERPVDPTIARAYPDYFLQSGANLGDRMANAIHETMEVGFEQVGIVGSDHPTLRPEIIDYGFSALTNHNIVLGPTLDGGYYCLMQASFAPELFDGVVYGRDDVLDVTLDRARMAELSVYLLDEWYDVDTGPDLNRLIDDLERDREICPNTRNTLKRLGIL